MASVWADKGPDDDPNHNQNQRDITVQITISVILGLSAFLAFCFLRPRWTGLYAARKRQKNAANSLPELPDSFFGWIPTLYRITEEEVLVSAGLDAFVFLSFFRLATKYIAIVFFFSLVVLLPIHVHESGDYGMPQHSTNSTKASTQDYDQLALLHHTYHDEQTSPPSQKPTDSMLWVYACFVYFFSFLLLYFIVTETKKIIRIRQEYLGSKSTVTDRTIRLSGIPEALRSEEMIKETIENLQIGKVESVLLCKDWKEIDNLMAKRMSVLRKLEEAWTVYLGHPKHGGNKALTQGSTPGPNPQDEESLRLLDGDSNDQSTHDAGATDRPTTRIWYGFLGLQSRSVDAIDYYEEKLRRLDEQIKSSRNKVFKPMPIAFVTMDSTAASQMAVQATMDPEPMTLLAKPAPPPSDVVWSNTYVSRSSRMLRAWSISLVIALLTIFWSLLLVPLAGLLSLENIGKVWPQLHDALDRHQIARSLVQQGLPTLVISLLTVAVPYLYYWLSTLQGMISQGEVEMSLISKNFFFTFFNLFVVFTIFGTASNATAERYRNKLGDSLKDTTTIAFTLAKSLKDLVLLYINLIILQGLGLFPLRLLEFGSVALYPISLIGAKTPRDYAEMVQPPVFSYGFYLPQSLLIFIICIVYSVLPASWFVLFFGLVYFVIGNFIYKYQLLYAMDHRRHSTGRAWPIICNRIVLGLVVFQLAMAGILGLNLAFYRSALIVPLIVFSIWFLVYYQRTYEPLMKFIAIRSLNHDPPFGAIPQGESRYESETSRGRDVDEGDETGLRYINPSLVLPLEEVWLAKERTDISGRNGNGNSREDSSGRTTPIRTSSQILLSRGVAGVDEDLSASESAPEALLITILENASMHVLSLGPSQPSNVTRYPETHAEVQAQSTAYRANTPTSLVTNTEALPLLPISNQSADGAVASPEQPRMSGTTNQLDAPLRPRATTRSSRANSAQSSFSFGGSSVYSGPHTESSEAESPTRGRTLARIPAQRTHNRRMTTIRQDRPKTIEWDSALTQDRLMSRDLATEPQGIFDLIKEPLPLGVERYRSSLSEELYKAATWDTLIDLSRFAEHRDTFALLGLRHLQSRRIRLPDAFFERLIPYIDFETFLAIRLSCRCWSEAITRVHGVFTPPVSHLPFELLEKIYIHLDPIDFNSARHTCRAWMITSLEENLLTLMLKRGGWWRAAKADADLQEQVYGRRTADSVNEEWMLSKRLATECSLRPDWTGNGLRKSSVPSGLDGIIPSLTITSTTDFSELSNGYGSGGDRQHNPALHFTVSVCNRFLLVTEGCLIYVYSIWDSTATTHQFGANLETVTTVICPHRVLAVSMDTSSHRFAIAALMEDRMGLVCDLSALTTESEKLSAPRALPTAIRDSRGQMYSPRSSSDHAIAEATNPHEYTTFELANDRAMAQAIAEATLPEIHGARTTRQSWTMNDPFLSPIEAPGSSQDYETPYRRMSVATGQRSIYRNLCSSEDPPRSVAICPQRRCVAFGCATGIELHWIDALTGQDLNRWFPLTASSDFLYFLPPRPGVDSAKKLRLISSAAHPKEKERLQGRFFPSRGNNAARYQSMTWDEEFQGVGLANSAWRGSGWCDHYQAVPLSDGWDVLFTDPEEGVLCLGSDAPPGARATKLSRRFTFAGPIDADGNAIVPRVYASGRELRWGVRIVVGYGEALWFFAVPSDIYFTDQHPASDVQEPNGVDTEAPTKIYGIEIGRVPALIDIAVDASGGDITVWAFAADGIACTWQIDSASTAKQQRVIERDGTIRPLQDADGDTFMYNMPGSAVYFDGNAAMPPATHHHSPIARVIDKDGDVTMRDATSDDEGYESEFEAAGGTFAIHAPPLCGRWSDDADWVPDYLERRGTEFDDGGVGVDVLEMSRIEVEVLGS